MPWLIPSQAETRFRISVCTKKMELILDDLVLNMLLEPGSMTEGGDLAFDKWFHALLATSGNDYNAL